MDFVAKVKEIVNAAKQLVRDAADDARKANNAATQWHFETFLPVFENVLGFIISEATGGAVSESNIRRYADMVREAVDALVGVLTRLTGIPNGGPRWEEDVIALRDMIDELDNIVDGATGGTGTSTTTDPTVKAEQDAARALAEKNATKNGPIIPPDPRMIITPEPVK